MIPNFPHKAPKGYSYEFEEFKRGVVAIWLRCHRKFDYNNGAITRTIWGFYSTKTKQKNTLPPSIVRLLVLV